MIRRIFTVALFAGLLAGLVVSAVQHFTTTPIIHVAEQYETAAVPEGVSPAAFVQAHAEETASGHNHADDAMPWMPRDGLERFLYTVLSNVIAGVGFGLLLVAGFALRGGNIDARQGVVWGAAGFVAFALAPGMGLPPELPGMYAADLVARQIWWLGTAVATAAGLAAMAFATGWPLRAVGLVLLVAPHVVGAPDGGVGGSTPPELAARFVAASLVTQAVFWTSLGWFAGKFHEAEAT